MECPLCKRTHPKSFEAYHLISDIYSSRHIAVFACKHCGIVFVPLTEEDRLFWIKKVGVNEKDQTPMP